MEADAWPRRAPQNAFSSGPPPQLPREHLLGGAGRVMLLQQRGGPQSRIGQAMHGCQLDVTFLAAIAPAARPAHRFSGALRSPTRFILY